MNQSYAKDVLDVLAHVPPCDRVIVVYPTETKGTAIEWAGMSAEQVVRILYSLADEVLAKRIPLPKPRAPEGPSR